jgi:hypothetical protein
MLRRFLGLFCFFFFYSGSGFHSFWYHHNFNVEQHLIEEIDWSLPNPYLAEIFQIGWAFLGLFLGIWLFKSSYRKDRQQIIEEEDS